MTPTSEASPEQPFRILSLDGGGIMGALAASALATVVGETDRRIVEHDDLMSRRNGATPPEPIDFCHDHVGFPSIRTCTLAEAHSRPGLVRAKEKQKGQKDRHCALRQHLEIRSNTGPSRWLIVGLSTHGLSLLVPLFRTSNCRSATAVSPQSRRFRSDQSRGRVASSRAFHVD